MSIQTENRTQYYLPNPTPERSLTQRMDALAIANDVRTKRAQLKRDLKAERVSVFTILATPPECANTMKIFELLLAVPKYGRVKVNKTLQICRISPSKTVDGLSDRQRSELISMVRRGGPAYPAASSLHR